MLFFIGILILIICIILRGFLFFQREESFWKTFIPFYNKIILGKLSNNKTLGIFNAVFSLLFSISIFISFIIELEILSRLSTNETLTNKEITSEIPNNLIQLNDISKFSILILGIILFILWIIMMRQFSFENDASTWWMIAWAFCPIVAYMYFCTIHTTYFTINKDLITYKSKKIAKKIREEKHEKNN